MSDGMIRRMRAPEQATAQADDNADVGVDEGTNVSVAYEERENKFTGTIEKITMDVR